MNALPHAYRVLVCHERPDTPPPVPSDVPDTAAGLGYVLPEWVERRAVKLSAARLGCSCSPRPDVSTLRLPRDADDRRVNATRLLVRVLHRSDACAAAPDEPAAIRYDAQEVR